MNHSSQGPESAGHDRGGHRDRAAHLDSAGETRNEDTVYAQVEIMASSDFETIAPHRGPAGHDPGEGSARSIQRQVLSQPRDHGIRWDPRGGRHEISLVDAIQNLPLIQQGDITILGTEPSGIDLEIDSMTELVPVQPVFTGVTLRRGGLESENATLTLPSRIVAQIPDPQVIAEPSPDTLDGLQAEGTSRSGPAAAAASSLRAVHHDRTDIGPAGLHPHPDDRAHHRDGRGAGGAPAMDYSVQIDPADRLLDVVVEGEVDLVKRSRRTTPWWPSCT